MAVSGVATRKAISLRQSYHPLGVSMGPLHTDRLKIILILLTDKKHEEESDVAVGDDIVRRGQSRSVP
jgi:hypothetical protein